MSLTPCKGLLVLFFEQPADWRHVKSGNCLAANSFHSPRTRSFFRRAPARSSTRMEWSTEATKAFHDETTMTANGDSLKP
jgi:hypothetical protein